MPNLPSAAAVASAASLHNTKLDNTLTEGAAPSLVPQLMLVQAQSKTATGTLGPTSTSLLPWHTCWPKP